MVVRHYQTLPFSCNYPQGKIAVVGKEDAGKTTLVRAIVGLEKLIKVL